MSALEKLFLATMGAGVFCGLLYDGTTGQQWATVTGPVVGFVVFVALALTVGRARGWE